MEQFVRIIRTIIDSCFFSCYSRFRELDSEMDKDRAYLRTRIQNEEVIKHFPELKANPFADRICHVFSSNKDGSMSFEDFVDMVSALGPNTPPKVKAEWAFQIFGMFDMFELISVQGKTVIFQLNKLLITVL